MLVTKVFKPVADWLFQDFEHKVKQFNKEALWVLLEKCQQILVVLEKYKLLYPRQISLDIWRGYDPISNKFKRTMEEPAQSFDIPIEVGAQGFLKFCEEVFDRLEQRRPFLFPADINIEGSGLIYEGENQTRELPEVTWINAHTLDIYMLIVNTQSDAWMPCNLRGEPQPEIYRLNAPRLEAALTEIYQALGFELLVDSENNDHERYAHVEGFKVFNSLDGNGEIMDMTEFIDEKIIE